MDGGVCCSAEDDNTRQYNWEIYNTPLQFFNVDGLTLANNSFSADAGCARSAANYATPIYLVNATNVAGVTAAPQATATFEAAADGGPGTLRDAATAGGTAATAGPPVGSAGPPTASSDGTAAALAEPQRTSAGVLGTLDRAGTLT